MSIYHPAHLNQEEDEKMIEGGKIIWAEIKTSITGSDKPVDRLLNFFKLEAPRHMILPLTPNALIAWLEVRQTRGAFGQVYWPERRRTELIGRTSEAFKVLLTKSTTFNIAKSTVLTDTDKENYIVGRALNEVYARLLGVVSVYFGAIFATLHNKNASHPNETPEVGPISTSLTKAIRDEFEVLRNPDNPGLLPDLHLAIHHLVRVVLQLSEARVASPNQVLFKNLGLSTAIVQEVVKTIVGAEFACRKAEGKIEEKFGLMPGHVTRMVPESEVATSDARFSAALIAFKLMTTFHNVELRQMYGSLDSSLDGESPSLMPPAIKSLGKYTATRRHPSNRYMCDRVFSN